MITFNGTASTDASFDIESIMRISRPISPGHRARLLEITGRAGVYYLGKDRRPLTHGWRIVLKSDSIAERRTAAHAIAAWLDTDDPEELTYTDEPNLRYNAVQIEPIDIDEFALVGFADVTFLIPAGYAESTTTSTASPNSGTLETPVEITATIVDATASSLKIAVNGGYVLVTTPLVSTDEIVIDTNLHKTTLNGDDAREYVSFGSQYFKLPVGAFTLDVDPATTTTAIVYRQRYK